MVGHHIGPNLMHPDRSLCLSLPANDQVDGQYILRAVAEECVFHSTRPRGCTIQ